MTVVFHPLAERELTAAATFYEGRVKGLGADFIREAERSLAKLVAHPDFGRLVQRPSIRRWLLRRFPFAIIYDWENESIRVLAIMHLRRRPIDWRGRLRTGSPRRP